MIEVVASPAFVAAGGPVQFGTAFASGVHPEPLRAVLAREGGRLIDQMRSDEALLRRRIELFDAHFAAFGYKCPLGAQLTSLLKRGTLPGRSPLVDLLLAAELGNGVLMGLQDADALHSPLSIDIASNGDSFEGMRGLKDCVAGEPVVRDGLGIVASYVQGPDKRSSLGEGSSNLVFFAFGPPAIESEALQEALASACNLVSQAADSATYAVFEA